MRILLEVIYEGKFSDLSHGFRPGRSCHTALKQVSKWKGITWMVSADIHGFFENVNHHLLANILGRQILDQRFIDLYWKLVRAGYPDLGALKYNTFTGLPQGLGILLPILSNIYLNEFDLYLQELINEYSTQKILQNPKIENKVKLRDLYPKNKDILFINKLCGLPGRKGAARQAPSRISHGFRIWYVRYADYWLIGLVGEWALAKKILDLCKRFLEKLNVELLEKQITNVTREKVRFLGVDIFVRLEKQICPRVCKRLIKRRACARPARLEKPQPLRLYFYLPVKSILDKLIYVGFIKSYTNGNGLSKLVPNAICKWIYLDHRSIILRYNAVIRGLLNYYGFVDNLNSLHSIINFFLHHSCAKTLARKLNLDHRAKSFKKFGRYLEAPGGKIRLYSPLADKVLEKDRTK